MNNDRQLFAAVRALPYMTIAKRDGEYRVTFLLAAISKAKPKWSMKRCQDHAERVSYYTADRDDALGTAKALSEHMAGIMARNEGGL